MIANKRIVARVPVDIQIAEVTLLSKEEFEIAENNISAIRGWWWLRSPGFTLHNAALVYDYDDGLLYDHDVDDDRGCVRPALRIVQTPYGLKLHDVIELAGYSWTIVCVLENYCYALCNCAVGETYFREDWKAENANNYETSDVRKWLENWVKEVGIEITEKGT